MLRLDEKFQNIFCWTRYSSFSNVSIVNYTVTCQRLQSCTNIQGNRRENITVELLYLKRIFYEAKYSLLNVNIYFFQPIINWGQLRLWRIVSWDKTAYKARPFEIDFWQESKLNFVVNQARSQTAKKNLLKKSFVPKFLQTKLSCPRLVLGQLFFFLWKLPCHHSTPCLAGSLHQSTTLVIST